MSRRRQSSSSFRLPKGTGWLVFIAIMVFLYFRMGESFWGIVGVLSCPAIVIAIIAANLRSKSSSSSPRRRKEWYIDGKSDKKWMEENDRRILGED